MKNNNRRTTHSDLAHLLMRHAEKMKAVPEGYCVSDPSSLRLLTDAALALVTQDLRIETLIVGLREIGTREARNIIVAAQADVDSSYHIVLDRDAA